MAAKNQNLAGKGFFCRVNKAKKNLLRGFETNILDSIFEREKGIKFVASISKYK
jgi:hypothetical protein